MTTTPSTPSAAGLPNLPEPRHPASAIGNGYTADQMQAYALAAIAAQQQVTAPPASSERVALTTLAELGRRYSLDFASPHHMTFSVEGLRNLIEAVTPAPRPDEATGQINEPASGKAMSAPGATEGPT